MKIASVSEHWGVVCAIPYIQCRVETEAADMKSSGLSEGLVDPRQWDGWCQDPGAWRPFPMQMRSEHGQKLKSFISGC